MTMKRWMILLSVSLPLLAGCASTAPPEDAARRVVGQEEGVRVEADLIFSGFGSSSSVSSKVVVTNQRPEPIAVADVISQTDLNGNTATVIIGSEVPGNQLVPRVLVIAPGQQRTFTGRGVLTGIPTPHLAALRNVRVKVNFLGDVRPFEQLTTLTARAVHDPKLADALFEHWVSANASVLTNTVPFQFATDRPSTAPPDASRRGGTTTRRRP